jgi:cysteinyl-tRNA synthetase
MNLYDSLSRRQKQVPVGQDGALTMYVCGVTVYDYCHLGHARSYVVWDVLKRWLSRQKKVIHVQNFTDVDDKIVKRANEEGVSSKDIADRFIEAYHQDMDWLGVERAFVYPRVTEYMDAMRIAARSLIESGNAYEKEGDIRFKTESFPQYGKLSRRTVREDFVLWKGAKANEPEFPKGRPGWHLECSIMIERTIGFTVDIHAGGNDLMFPHHENEIAQSECLHVGTPLANHWLHNGMVEVGEGKMGKSDNNAVNIRSFRMAGVDPNVLRYWILSAGYRKPLSVTPLNDGTAARQWATLRDRLRVGYDRGVSPKFVEAMDDDMNTPAALVALLVAPTMEMAEILGFRLFEDGPIPADVLEISNRRDVLRGQKKWSDADALKKEIIAAGYDVHDKPDGPSTVTKR